MDLIESVPTGEATITSWLAKLKTTLGGNRSRHSKPKNPDETSSALLQLAHVLLQGIRVHAVAGDQEDLDSFKSEFERLDTIVAADADPSQILLVAGSADQALQVYNRQITRFIRAQRVELQRMVATLTETVATISNGSERSYTQLEDIGWRIQKACVIEDIRVINLHLSECLKALQEETLRQKDAAAKAITLLKKGLETQSEVGDAPTSPEPAAPVSGALTAPATPHPSNGLGDRAAAESAIRSALQGGTHTFAAVFNVKGVQAIEARSGSTGVEQASKLFVQGLNERHKFERIYWWGQACFVALLERPEPLEVVQLEISRVTSRRMDVTIESRGRSAFIPLCSSATVIPIFNMRSMEMLVQQIEASMRL